MKRLFILLTSLIAFHLCTSGQNFTEILSRPESESMNTNLLFDAKVEVYWEYGLSNEGYTHLTEVNTAEKDVPLNHQFSGLIPDTSYHYRIRYRAFQSGGVFLAGDDHWFHTARSVHKSFSFAVEADPHLDTNTNSDAYFLTLDNILSEKPDFMIDLGDNFMSEKLPQKTQAEITNRHLLYRPYFGSVCHSVPLFLVLGNHEGEVGWSLTGSANSLPVMASNTRKKYYPNPLPDDFYSGDTVPETFVGLRENYYAWEWGDALFIVLDPYWYTTVKPDWGWTLGLDQYNWFKSVLEKSGAKYKFVFCHQLVGGSGTDARGGTEYADFFEMGGKNSDMTEGFETHRPGWGKSIHQLMLEYNVSAFFHGHDHCYARQEKDGIIYQEVPQPSAKNISNFTGDKYGYTHGVLTSNRGYLLVTVSDTATVVKYIKTYLPSEQTGGHQNKEVIDNYMILGKPNGLNDQTNHLSSLDILSAYPNPCTDKFTILFKTQQSEKVTMEVINLFGKRLFTKEYTIKPLVNNSITFNPKEYSLHKGIYFIHLTCANECKTIKMILND